MSSEIYFFGDTVHQKCPDASILHIRGICFILKLEVHGQSVFVNYVIFSLYKRKHIVYTFIIYSLGIARKEVLGNTLYLVCDISYVFGIYFNAVNIGIFKASEAHHLSCFSFKGVLYSHFAYAS